MSFIAGFLSATKWHADYIMKLISFVAKKFTWLKLKIKKCTILWMTVQVWNLSNAIWKLRWLKLLTNCFDIVVRYYTYDFYIYLPHVPNGIRFFKKMYIDAFQGHKRTLSAERFGYFEIKIAWTLKISNSYTYGQFFFSKQLI